MLQRKPPNFLTPEECAIWDEVIPLIAGRAEQNDLFAVANFCRDEALLRKCFATIAAEGMWVECKKEGKRRHPMLTATGAIQKRHEFFFRQFGMTPKSREEFPDHAPPEAPVETSDDLQSSVDGE